MRSAPLEKKEKGKGQSLPQKGGGGSEKEKSKTIKASSRGGDDRPHGKQARKMLYIQEAKTWDCRKVSAAGSKGRESGEDGPAGRSIG